MVAKKLNIRLFFKILLFSHAICQVIKEGHLNAQHNNIQAMLRASEQLAVKANYFEVENKRLIKALKAEKKK